MTVEYADVLSEVNDFGKYQITRYLLICAAGLMPSIGKFHQISCCFLSFTANNRFQFILKSHLFAFICGRQAFIQVHNFISVYFPVLCGRLTNSFSCILRCKHPNVELNDTFSFNSSLYTDFELGKCTYNSTLTNQTNLKCSNFVFDKTYYKTTLTEDVHRQRI